MKGKTAWTTEFAPRISHFLGRVPPSAMATAWLDQSPSASVSTFSTYHSNSTCTNSTSFGDGAKGHSCCSGASVSLVAEGESNQRQTSRTLTSHTIMTSTDRGLVKDMRSASPAVLRRTARDVFEQKMACVKENSNRNGTTDSCDNDDGDRVNGAPPVLELSPEDRIPKFDERDLVRGRVLGRGAFCVVWECNVRGVDGAASVGSDGSNGLIGRFMGSGNSSSRRRQTSVGASSSSKANKNSLTASVGAEAGPMGNSLSSCGISGHNLSSSARSAGGGSVVSETSRRPRKGRYRYVVKQLSPDLQQNDRISYLKGVVDLAMETKLLASIDHENIVCLHGIASCGPFEEGYFVVLEKINDTLGKKVKGWMDMDRQCKGITGVFTGSKKKLERLQTERIAAAYHLALGMNYLHQRRIVFRDLKPDNVGFDYVGILKVFDFGLAREIMESDRTEDGLYRMTGCTGAVRYMSPENAKNQPYDLSTDIYSFAMLLWFMFALEPPFSMYTENMILDRVCNRGYRPKLFAAWSHRLSKLIGMSWSENPKERPSFAIIANELRKEMADLDPKFARVLEEESENQLLPGIDE